MHGTPADCKIQTGRAISLKDLTPGQGAREMVSMAFLDGFLDFLNSLPDGLIYLLLGVSAFVENVFPPVPGDTITAFGAFLVGTQRLSFFGVYLSTTAGSTS